MLKVFREGQGRLRSDFYNWKDTERFALAEKMLHGVLISEYNRYGEVLEQLYKKSQDPLSEIGLHLAKVSPKLELIEERVGQIIASARCDNCGKGQIVREFDTFDVSKVREIPVVPIFVCTHCQKHFYSMSKEYLERLVERNPEMFDQKELREKEQDKDRFLEEIQQYMIRVFASKKLAMLKMSR